MTSVRVPRRVRERVEAVAPQLYEQDQLSEEMDQHFSPLREASSVAFGVSDKARKQGRFPRPSQQTVSGEVELKQLWPGRENGVQRPIHGDWVSRDLASLELLV